MPGIRWVDSAAFLSGNRPIWSAATMLETLIAFFCLLSAFAWPTSIGLPRTSSSPPKVS
jgi:hypothetical protein